MKTKDIIIKSAFELFCEKKFSDISVQDIIDRAGCSRFSFYKYFNDKYELMHLYYRSAINEMLANHYTGRNFVMTQAEIFRFIRDNDSYFLNIKDFTGADSFWTFLSGYTTDFFTAVKCENSGQDTLTEQEKIEMMFVVNGAVSVFRFYVEKTNSGLTPVQISELLCSHYPDDYYILPEDKIEGFRRRIK